MSLNAATIIIALVVAWVAQLSLSLQQMRRFYSRMAELREEGRTSFGLEGSKYQGRVYTVLVVDKNDKITHAEMLSGLTVFATLQPVPNLVGLSLNALMLNEFEVPIKKKVLASFKKAAKAFYEEVV